LLYVLFISLARQFLRQRDFSPLLPSLRPLRLFVISLLSFIGTEPFSKYPSAGCCCPTQVPEGIFGRAWKDEPTADPERRSRKGCMWGSLASTSEPSGSDQYFYFFCLAGAVDSTATPQRQSLRWIQLCPVKATEIQPSDSQLQHWEPGVPYLGSLPPSEASRVQSTAESELATTNWVWLIEQLVFAGTAYLSLLTAPLEDNYLDCSTRPPPQEAFCCRTTQPPNL